MTSHTAGFVDLRVHHLTHASHSDESIWPSFTDIMMVIVMVFLMASVIFITRNVELAQKLTEALETESVAERRSQTLELQMLRLNTTIDDLNALVRSITSQRDILAETTVEQSIEISELERQMAVLERARAEIDLETDTMRLEISQLERVVAKLRVERNELTQSINASTQVATDLQNLLDQRQAELEQLQVSLLNSQQDLELTRSVLQERSRELAALTQEHSELQAEQAGQQSQNEGQIAALAAKTQQLDTLNKAYSEKLEELDLLRTEFTKQEQELERLAELSGSQREQIGVLTESARQRTEKVKEQEEQLVALRELYERRVEELTREARVTRDEFTAQGVEIAKLVTLNEVQTKELQELRDRSEQRGMELAAAQEQLSGQGELIFELRRQHQERVEALELQVRTEISKVLELNAKLAELRSDQNKTTEELSQLRTAYQERLQEISVKEEEVAHLRGQIVGFEEGQIMLRPERSPLNRYVVRIWYTRPEGTTTPVVFYSLPNQIARSNQVSISELEETLSLLKNQREEGLFLRIIIDENSRISHSEAVRFAQVLRSKYDYYSQSR